MRRSALSIATFAMFVAASSVQAQAGSMTFKVDKWNIGGEGGTDYVTAEPGTSRVFVSQIGRASCRERV